MQHNKPLLTPASIAAMDTVFGDLFRRYVVEKRYGSAAVWVAPLRPRGGNGRRSPTQSPPSHSGRKCAAATSARSRRDLIPLNYSNFDDAQVEPIKVEDSDSQSEPGAVKQAPGLAAKLPSKPRRAGNDAETGGASNKKQRSGTRRGTIRRTKVVGPVCVARRRAAHRVTALQDGQVYVREVIYTYDGAGSALCAGTKANGDPCQFSAADGEYCRFHSNKCGGRAVHRVC